MTIIEPQKGQVINIRNGQSIKIIDIEGEQVADFWAFNSDNENEYFSAAVTIDCNSKLLISTGDTLYTNLFNPLFRIEEDTSGIHDLVHPCCRQEMYEHFYDNKSHPSCLQNINDGLLKIGKTALKEIHPFNIFMNAQVQEGGKITIQKPVTKPGDYIILRPLLENITILIASCSVDSGNLNGGHCSSIGFEILQD